MQFHRKTQRKPGGGHTFSLKIYPKAHQKYPQVVKKDGKHSSYTSYKRTQNGWPTTPNIVRCYMLRSFGYPVACCCVLLGDYYIRLYTTNKMDATTLNIFDPTMLGVVVSVCTTSFKPFHPIKKI